MPSKSETQRRPQTPSLKLNDKVKVVKNTDPKLKSFVGKRGKVAGSVTDFSCRVKIVNDNEYWFDLRELEKE